MYEHAYEQWQLTGLVVFISGFNTLKYIEYSCIITQYGSQDFKS